MLNRLKIGLRLVLGFALVVVLVVLVAALGRSRVGELNGQLDVMVTDRMPKVLIATSTKEIANRIAINLRSALLSKDPAAAQNYVKTVPEMRQTIGENLKELEALMKSDKDKALFATLQEKRKAYGASIDKAVALINQ